MKIMKKTLAIILTCILALSCAGISFAAGEDYLTFTLKNGEAQLALCDRDAKGVIDIPSEVTISGKTYNVAFIGIKAFYGCTGVTQINIPEGVRTVGSKAFADCTALTDIYMPSSLVTCQYDAFDGCNEMTVHCYTTSYQFFSVYGFNENVSVEIIDKENIYDEEDAAQEESGLGTIEKIVTIFRSFLDELLAYFGVSLNDKEFELEDIKNFLPSGDDGSSFDDSILGSFLGEILPEIQEEEDDGILGGIFGDIF